MLIVTTQWEQTQDKTDTFTHRYVSHAEREGKAKSEALFDLHGKKKLAGYTRVSCEVTIK